MLTPWGAFGRPFFSSGIRTLTNYLLVVIGLGDTTFYLTVWWFVLSFGLFCNVMEVVMALSVVHRDMLIDAVNLKLASLNRGLKGSSPSFLEVYRKEIAEYSSLVQFVMKL